MNPTPPTPERVCETCGGSGAIDTISKEDGRDSYRKCSSCYGTGQEPTPQDKLDDLINEIDADWSHDGGAREPHILKAQAQTKESILSLLSQAKAEGYREGQRDGAIEEAHEMARWYVKNSGFGSELTGPGEHAQFRIRQARVRYDQLHKGENNGNLYCY